MKNIMTNLKRLIRNCIMVLGILILVMVRMDTMAIQEGSDYEYEYDVEYLEGHEYNDENDDENELDDEIEYEEDVPFAIRLVIPDNQIDDSESFFNLEMDPGEEQTLMVEMFNSGSYPIQVNIDVATAFTNDRITIDYSGTETQPDETLLHLMEDIIEIERPMVEMEPFSIITFYFNIEMPEDSFNGVLAGGLNFQMLELESSGSENDDDNDENEYDGGLTPNDPLVRNLYAYTVAVLIHQGYPIAPELVIRDMIITPVGPQIEVRAHFHNIEPAFANNVHIRSLIVDSQTSEVLFNSATEGNLGIAPNSNFYHSIFPNEGLFTDREYIVTYYVDSDGGSWEFSETVRFTGAEIDEDEVIYEEDIILEEEPELEAYETERGFPWLVLILIFVGVLVLGAIFFFAYHKRRGVKDAQLETIQRQLVIKLMEESLDNVSEDLGDDSNSDANTDSNTESEKDSDDKV